MPTTRPASPLAPPPSADLVLAFVNTHAGGHPDVLRDGAGLQTWAQAAGFGAVAATDADAAAARELRAALATLLLHHAGDGGDVAAAEAHLQRAAARYPVRVVVVARGAVLQPGADEVGGIFAAVLAAAAELALRGAWPRMKACRNPRCRHAFYDRTRNGAGQYHSAGCGSAVSMRAYRERQRGAAATPSR